MATPMMERKRIKKAQVFVEDIPRSCMMVTGRGDASYNQVVSHVGEKINYKNYDSGSGDWVIAICREAENAE